MKAHCCLSGMRGGVIFLKGGMAGAADVAGLVIGSGLVSPPEAGGTLSIKVSVRIQEMTLQHMLSLSYR